MKLETHEAKKGTAGDPPDIEHTEKTSEWIQTTGEYMEAVAMIAFTLSILVIGAAWTTTIFLWIKTTQYEERQ